MTNHIKHAVQNYRRQHPTAHGPIKGALFDMDGTLYDSMPAHARAWMLMCQANNIPARLEDFFLLEGSTGANTLRILARRNNMPEPSPQQIHDLYHQKTVNFQAQPPVPVMPGAQQLAAYCLSQGLTCVLVTGSGQSSLINRLPHDFPGVFNPALHVTGHNVTQGKPHPEPYLRAMQNAGATPEGSVAFENAPLGVESAHRSGAFTVAVTTGPIPAQDFINAGADIIFNSMPLCTKHFPELLYYLNNSL